MNSTRSTRPRPAAAANAARMSSTACARPASAEVSRERSASARRDLAATAATTVSVCSRRPVTASTDLYTTFSDARGKEAALIVLRAG